MKFRTELEIAPLPHPIDYADPVLLIGSCFADRMREKLRSLKFRASGDFCGPLFNPASIASAVRRAAEGRAVRAEELHRDAEGWWFHYDTHTLADDPDPAQVLARCNAGQEALRQALEQARHVVVTFGTAWVYRLRDTGAVVANCHKQPAELFSRERLTVPQIVADWSELLAGPLAGRQVLLTVSPVRHLGDGLDGNCLSKSILRVACAELEERHENVHYFPAYELLVDDLRDYRFYADDLVHPAPAAVEYIWERFAQAALSERTRELLGEVQRVLSLAGHTPRRPESDAWRALCRRTAGQMRALEKREGLDFSDEIARLERCTYR
ncbi:GSCFA domain-containing protein [Alistipes sp.]|uniref:GSCFA domain-containing protein n=1 Tax=Alistipes sp. TaxID=1872444 RepID=UPI003AF1AD30